MSGSRFGPSLHVGRVSPLWHARCQLDTKGNPIPNLHNCCLALEEDPEFAGKFSYDEMLRCPMLEQTKVEDDQLVEIHRSIQVKGIKRISLDVVHEAVRYVAYHNRVHPLRDWLNSLAWDGTLRLADWLATYLGAPASPYAQAVGPWFLTSMVARILQPGCQVDYMLVLEGSQGELKSQCCRALADPYFSDHLPSLSSDEVRLSAHLRGKWLIEISELSAFSKADASALKSFITRQEEIYTPKFSRVEVYEKRMCCFIGTTNDDLYLKDDTGGRRFWPLKCGTIDLEALRRDRDQLFAEAAEAFHRGAQWWPDRKFEKDHIAPVQTTRLWVDAWDAPVRKWLASQISAVSLMEVAEGALAFPPSRFGVAEQRRLGTLMRSIGWTLHRTNQARYWEPPAVTP